MSQDERRVEVAVVDAHPGILMSTAMVLELDGIQVAAATQDLDLATRLCLAGRANVLVIDPHVREGSSRATIAGLRLQLPEVPIVVMSMESSPAFARVAIRAGANGYVLKSQADTELPLAIREIASGGQFISPFVASADDAADAAAG